MHDFDSPWKELVGRYFPQFLAFFFPEIAAEADPAEDDEQLEQELRKILPTSGEGKRVVDRLAKMKTRDDDIRFLHAEVQARWEDDLPRRIHQYNSRAGDHLGQEVVSVVILADDNPDWRPDTYTFKCWGCVKTFKYPVVKVLDYAGREAELEADPNPVGLFVSAHLASRRTAGDDEKREAEKLRLTVLMLERKLDDEDRRHWYRFLDWLLPLPRDAELRIMRAVQARQEEGKMAFITFAERYGREQGMEKGILLGKLEVLLELKHGDAGKALAARFAKGEPALLEKAVEAARAGRPLPEVEALLPA